MKHAQEVEGWALDEGNRITQTMSLNEATYVTVAKGLQRQHARSVRIIKAEMKRVKMDQHTYRSEERCLILGSLETVLNALQRGRGGKG